MRTRAATSAKTAVRRGSVTFAWAFTISRGVSGVRMPESETELVEVPLSLVQELADNHKEVARYGYDNNRTSMADLHHSWARRLADADTREWGEIAE